MSIEGEYVPSPAAWVRNQVETFEETNGAKANTIQGRPIVVITSLGHSSGKVRKNPVMRVEHDGVYAAVASKGGAPENPSWVANFLAHPEVDLQDGPEKKTYRAAIVEGEDRVAWWDRAVAAFPPYAEYQTKTDREIPVFLLTPVD